MNNRNGNGFGQVGFYVAPELERVYREIAALMGIPNPVWGGLEDCDVIIVDGISLTSLRKIGDKPLIVVCGQDMPAEIYSEAHSEAHSEVHSKVYSGVHSESPGLRVKVMPFNLGSEATRLLMEGRPYTEERAGEPVLDLMLEELRGVLRENVRNYLELPPLPWGHAYAMTLTHDIDILSLKEMPVARTFLGYFYRSSLVNWRRWRSGKVGTSEFARAVWEMVRTWAAKLGLGTDVWQRALPLLLDLEKRLGVRSSLYFMPFPGKPGVLPASRVDPAVSAAAAVPASAPGNRASFYDVTKKRELLTRIESEGWEAGVHGIDAWYSAESAKSEHERVFGVTGEDDLGVRMHWLYFDSPASFQALEEGGFLYDATFGYNEVVGFRAGTLQPYHPLNCQRLWELPLHIQDGALMGEEHGGLSREDSFQEAKPILEWARRYGGAVSLLWHNQSFTAPRFWGEVYERLIEAGKQDKAWIATPREVLKWFSRRRECRVSVKVSGSANGNENENETRTGIESGFDSGTGTCLTIDCNYNDLASPADSNSAGLPEVRVRLYLDPDNVQACSVPYEAGNGYIDVPARSGITLTLKGDEF